MNSPLKKVEQVLPIERRSTPVAGVKWACLSDENIKQRVITSVNMPASYAMEATAVCLSPDHVRHPRKVAPQLDCTYGFYAWKHLPTDDPWRARSWNIIGGLLLLLEVELTGRVIECTLGYRAQHQRVLTMHVAPSLDGPHLSELARDAFPADTLVLHDTLWSFSKALAPL